MTSLPRLNVLIVALSCCALAATGALPGSANTGASSSTHMLITLTPSNLRQPANAAECLQHVYNNGQGYFEHAAYGCSHPTANYIHLIWDYAGKADGFHIYRTDAGRVDYGIHSDGTVAQIYYAGGRACFVVAAVTGTSESPDSNQYCIYPAPARVQAIPH